MKTKLLFTKQNSNKLYLLLVVCLCFNLGWSQTELVQNGTADDFIHTDNETGPPVVVKNVNDNADAWDMTPNSTVIDNNGAEVTSPYRYDADDNPNGWRNDDLETYLSDTYKGGGSVNEQPGSTSDGAYFETVKTRGVKLYDETRRLYQKIVVEPGAEYIFRIESRSEEMNVPSEVFMLNEEITTEEGLHNGVLDSRVDAFYEITNDYSDDGKVFVTSSFEFTATTSTVVIYVRALLSTSDKQVFFDNISLVKSVTASVDDVLASKFKVYPNPANDVITVASKNINITAVSLYSVLGKQVLPGLALKNDRLNISELAKGVYFLKINSDQGSVTKRIIKE